MLSQTLRQLEEELHVQIVPGTEIMTDVGSHHFVKSSDRVLVPQPSDDPHDPLVSSALFEWGRGGLLRGSDSADKM